MNVLIESKKKWLVERPDEQIVDLLTTELAIPSVHAKILVSRGITEPEEAKAFLHMDASAIHDPFLLYDMDKAVELIQQAVSQNKKIAVYGDYDADGVTSIAVLKTALERLGADVFFVIPDRFEHGYGPNSELFGMIYEQGASLLITVDNGVSGIDEVAYAKSLGMDIIITDHHEAGEQWPEADAIIHPRHPDGAYPYPDLAGVGVAFKLACALLGEVPQDLLELVAIGTVADLVPLRGENRYFVKCGLERMRVSKRPGIQALAKVAATEQSQLTEESLGFMIGPRINAAGRLGDAAPAVDLLTTEEATVATSLANQLDALNKERQALVSEMTKEAEALIDQLHGNEVPSVFVIAQEGWNTGVVGIVASRLTEKYYRPSVVLSIDPESGMAKGSARSIEGFHMYEELAKNNRILPSFGGHPMAAGMSLEAADIRQLRENLNEQAEASLTAEQLVPKMAIDVPLSLDEIDIGVLESMDRLRPFGMGFEKPVYMIEGVKAESIRKIGAARNHLKLDLVGDGGSLDAIGFGFGEVADQMTPGVQLSVAGDLQVNEWNGNKKPQILVRDILVEEWQLFDLRGIRESSRWLHMIPAEHTAFIAFKDQTANDLQSSLSGHPIRLYGRDKLHGVKHLVLLDIPDDVSSLESLVREQMPDRIYAHFYVPESTYFNGLPGRDQFGWYYSFLKSRQRFDFRTNGEALAKHKGWRTDSVSFMSKVFSELGFVKIENGFVTFAETTEKRNLTEAPTYKERERQIALEEKLLYAPYSELKRWFDTMRTETAAREEQVI